MANGYYVMKRGWMDHPIFRKEKFTEREAWEWLISEACYEPHKYRAGNTMITLARGQVPTSYRKMAEKWGWGVNRVRGFLDLLKNESQIVCKTDTGSLIISICNYSKYQLGEEKTDTQTDTLPDTLPDTQPDTQPDTYIKNKEGKEFKEKGTLKGTQKESFKNVFDFNLAIEDWNTQTGGRVNPKNSQQQRTRCMANAVKRLAENYELPPQQAWARLCQKVSESDWLAGRKEEWKADLDWVLRPANLTKIMEGKYDNRNHNNDPKGCSVKSRLAEIFGDTHQPQELR